MTDATSAAMRCSTRRGRLMGLEVGHSLASGRKLAPLGESCGTGDLVDAEAQGAQNRSLVAVEAVQDGRHLATLEDHEPFLVSAIARLRGCVADEWRDSGDRGRLGIVEVYKSGDACTQGARDELDRLPRRGITDRAAGHAVEQPHRVGNGIVRWRVTAVPRECSAVDHEVPASARAARADQLRVSEGQMPVLSSGSGHRLPVDQENTSHSDGNQDVQSDARPACGAGAGLGQAAQSGVVADEQRELDPGGKAISQQAEVAFVPSARCELQQSAVRHGARDDDRTCAPPALLGGARDAPDRTAEQNALRVTGHRAVARSAPSSRHPQETADPRPPSG